MSRYKPLQLEIMAKGALAAKNQGDPRYLELVLRLAVRLNLAPSEVETKIEQLSRGEVATCSA